MEIASQLYEAPVGSLPSIIRYEKDVNMLRSMVLKQRRSAITRAAERNALFNWVCRISKQGAWDEIEDPLSLKGVRALPMPVTQSDEQSLEPFFDHLARGGTYEQKIFKGGRAGIEPYSNTELIEFEKGVLYADGRMDFCKMVAGPRSIGNLMKSLESNSFVKHFLLGNNIIGPNGAQAIASFIHKRPNRTETWYLAGNCIDTAGFHLLTNSMIKSTAITNVWMKRNPLGCAAAKDVFRLITQTANLRTLDLDQTELGDDGVAELFDLLANHISPDALPLRHLYLNVCGIGEKACIQIARYLQSPQCTLESLYVGDNPTGHAAAILAVGLTGNSTLRRLVMQSCGLKDDDCIGLAEAMKEHKSITVLDIGQSYATEDLGMRFNWTTDSSAPALADLIRTTKIEYINVSYVPISQFALTEILEAISMSESMVWFHIKPLIKGAKDWASVKAGIEQCRLYKVARRLLHKNVWQKYGMDYASFERRHKRFLISPPDVRNIDSVYRNRDSANVRRGFVNKLEKQWSDGDDTLQRVQDGTLN